MKTDLFARLKEWEEGNWTPDQGQAEASSLGPREEKEIKEPKKKTIRSLEKKELHISAVQYRVISVIVCLILSLVLVGTVNFLPGFADEDTPTTNEVYEHYIEAGRDQTGAVNTVAGMILDYRAFDTLGESFVLFTATVAVLLLLEHKKGGKKKRADVLNYETDPIVSSLGKVLIPIIFVVGVYILLNGHLSPGGGFSGGAVLGAGFILYAMIFGEEKAVRVLSEKTVKIVSIASLSFYCLAKSYSFFTGNEFNGIHSVIGPGNPGDLLSGGLIMPLNVAVGLVVCCTMYSFYMLFKRGRLD